MRHRIKKIPTLSKISHVHHLLHSDKSTYFYKSNGKVKNILYSPSIPLLGGAVLLLVLGVVISPISTSKNTAYAETIDIPASTDTEAASIAFKLDNQDIDGSTVSTDVNPDKVSYISKTLKITTNNIRKYSITIQSASDNGNLVNNDNGAIVEPISSAMTPDSFANNTWGYALSDNTAATDEQLTYSPLPAFQEEPTAQYISNKPNDGDYSLKLVFAAKIGSNKPAGHYKTTALLSVAAEANYLQAEPTDPVYSWERLEYMQQMTPEACKSIDAPVENVTDVPARQLIDVRDNKTYWVAKLADGNCWMTQNLDYDDPDATKIPNAGGSTLGPSYDWENNVALRQYWDPGYAYYTDGTTRTASDEALAKDLNGNVNAHYLQGNYYSWLAAVAGASNGGTEITGVCPDGWQLPISNSTATKSFNELTKNISKGSDLIKSPYYYIFGGFVSSGSAYDIGKTGYYWPSTPKNATNAYYLFFDSGSIRPSYDYDRYRGMTVRCVAR